jgi:transmembrane sensor
VAASVLLILFAGFYWAFAHIRGGPHEYATAVGGFQIVRLGDGSEVTLNTNTHLRVELGNRARRIELDSGEAYFVVAKDPSRPFTVRVADHKVTAVGTQFAIKRTPPGAQVLVVQGRVELRSSSAGTAEGPVTLDAGTLARTVKSEVMVARIAEAEAELLLSWRSGFVVFRDTSLADAAAELNQYLPRKLFIEDSSVASIKLSGRFRTDNLDAFLSLLQQGFPVTVEETADGIVLKRRP